MDASLVRRVGFGLTAAQPIGAVINEERRSPAMQHDMHYELELGIVLAGRMRRRFDRHEYIAQPGNVWLCGIWEPHGYAVQSAVSRALVLVIRPELLVQLNFDEAPELDWLAPFHRPPAERPQPDTASRQRTLAWARRFEATLGRSDAATRVLQRLLTIELLLFLMGEGECPLRESAATALARSGAGRSDPSPAGHYGRIGKAVELVFARRGQVAAGEAAAVCGLSRNHFDRLFQGVMHLSFGKFALRHRLGGAAGDLCRGLEALKKIAADWGFTDASHLVHAFRQHYGCTPVQYRARMATEPAALAPPPTAVVWGSTLPRDGARKNR